MTTWEEKYNELYKWAYKWGNGGYCAFALSNDGRTIIRVIEQGRGRYASRQIAPKLSPKTLRDLCEAAASALLAEGEMDHAKVGAALREVVLGARVLNSSKWQSAWGGRWLIEASVPAVAQ